MDEGSMSPPLSSLLHARFFCRQKYGLSNHAKQAKVGDGDNDGLEILETGLDPNDPAKVFRGELMEVTSTTETIRWQSAPDTVYSIGEFSNLGN